jgi:hypothetical protein
MKAAGHSAVLALALTLSGVLPSCDGPGWALSASEPDAELFLDGTRVGRGEARVPFRYYGASDLTVLPAHRRQTDDPRPPERRRIDLPAPAPLWLFPLDFLIEAWQRRLVTAADASAAVEVAPPSQTMVAGEPPTRLASLRQRADAARVAR